MSATQQNAEFIYSDLGTDPDFGELVEMYVEEMPDRVATLQQAHAAADTELLQRTAHQLKGASGSYGFPMLTPYAAALEYAVRDDEPEEAILKALNELIDVCGRLRSGAPQ